MTVKELIKYLLELPMDAVVVDQYVYQINTDDFEYLDLPYDGQTTSWNEFKNSWEVDKENVKVVMIR